MTERSGDPAIPTTPSPARVWNYFQAPLSPARKHILIEDRRGYLAGSGGDGDGIVYVVGGRAGAVAAGILKAVP
jgi:hypothetical protein